jgi:hypothetical protein
MAAFALCPAVRSKEVVSFCPRTVVYALDFPQALKGIFNSGTVGNGNGGNGNLLNDVQDFAAVEGDAASLRSKFTNHSTPCVRHFTNPM